MKLKLSTLGFGVIVASAFAAAHAGSPADYFNKIDADASGMITQAEYVAFKTADGKVTEADAISKFTAVAGDDGSLSLAEYEAAVTKAEAKAKSSDCASKKESTA